MEITLPPELSAKLNRAAEQRGRKASQLVQELVADYLQHDEWFSAEVAKGLSSLDSGQSVPHEEVGRQMQSILRSK